MSVRCLIVDDNVDFLTAATELLEQEGISVVGVASTSSEALELAEELRPHLTLVDVDLGSESGFDLARRLAQNARRPAMDVILISTYSERDLAELLEECPTIGFMSKSDLSGSAIQTLLGS